MPAAAKVLIVDDQPANLMALEAVLQEIGATLVRAGSGAEALARTLEDDFAAILLDVRMPGMDGFETARLIRSRPRSRTTPILFITAADSAELYLAEAYAMGAVDFLTKPVHPAVLKGKVSFFIELQRSREELRQAERQAVNERAFLAAVLEAVQDAIVACDPQGNLTLFNRATRELHGQSGRPLPPDKWTLYQADGQTPLTVAEMPLTRALAGERVRNAEMLVVPDDGKPRLLVASGQTLYDSDSGVKLGAVVSMHDVTAQREAEAARELAVREQGRREAAEAAAERLRASEERYRNLFESMDEGFCVVEMLFDADGEPSDYRFLEANPAFEKQTGLDDVVGKRMLELVPGHEAHWFDIYGRVARTGQAVRFIERADSLERWFDVYAGPVPGPDRNKVAVLFSDISDRKRNEEDLRRLATELAESDRRKTEFLATLAHELRNPLAPLRNGLHVLRQSSDPKALARTRDMMDRQLSHMVRLIDDLLDIARVSSGKVELKRQRIDLRQVVDSAVETSLPLVEAAGHALDVMLPPEPLPLDVDPTRLAQVLGNLLNNAAKYTPERGRIELAARREGDHVAISITDTGIGIPEQAMAEVFQMFTQVGRNSQHSQGGLGIGLALVRALVELHGGRIAVDSAGAGRGSVFTVTLPLAALPEAAAAAPAALPPSGTPSFQVLVVDDNEDAAESLALILQMDGHVARVANNGPQALQVAGEFHPQVVFLDIGMPGMDGYEVARRLRREMGTRQPVLVALTGWGAQGDLARSREAGFDHHLTKPADIAAVEKLLASLSVAA